MTELLGGGAFTEREALIARAESAIEGLRAGFREEASRQIERLEAAFAALSADPASGLEELFAAAHEIKGQAGSFGYELLAHVCEWLCRVVDGRRPLDKSAIDAIGHHVMAARVIVERDVRGLGGPLCSALLRDLQV